MDAIARPGNRIYQWHFVRDLKSRMRRKAKLFPGRFALNGMGGVRTVREFDEAITAPHCGYRDAADYYERASALRTARQIAVPTLILTSKDDPVVPFASFERPEMTGIRDIKSWPRNMAGIAVLFRAPRGRNAIGPKRGYWSFAKRMRRSEGATLWRAKSAVMATA